MCCESIAVANASIMHVDHIQVTWMQLSQIKHSPARFQAGAYHFHVIG